LNFNGLLLESGRIEYVRILEICTRCSDHIFCTHVQKSL
jgi:hypothetical protein